MIFQWYLFVIIIAAVTFSNLSGRKYLVNSYGRTEVRYKWVPALMVLIPLVYLAATRENYVWSDTVAYRVSFLELPTSIWELDTYITEDTKDKGFIVLATLIKMFIGDNDVLYFGIIAGVTLYCVISVFRKHSCNFFVSVFLFIASADYVQWEYNGIRQFIAVAIIFACMDWILEKRYIPLIMVILLVSTVHATALLMIPVIFIVQGKAWNRKTVFVLFLVLIAVASVEHFTDLITDFMGNTQYKNEVGQFLETEGTSIFRVLVFSIPTIISLLFRKRIQKGNNKVINLCVNMSIASMGCYIISAVTSGIFMGRIPIYFSLYNYILLPWMVENIFSRRSRRFIYTMMIGLYLIYYYYQIHVVWGI